MAEGDEDEEDDDDDDEEDEADDDDVEELAGDALGLSNGGELLAGPTNIPTGCPTLVLEEEHHCSWLLAAEDILRRKSYGD